MTPGRAARARPGRRRAARLGRLWFATVTVAESLSIIISRCQCISDLSRQQYYDDLEHSDLGSQAAVGLAHCDGLALPPGRWRAAGPHSLRAAAQPAHSQPGLWQGSDSVLFLSPDN
jgi:hypothetical protein